MTSTVLSRLGSLLLPLCVVPALAANPPLVVVKDLGGVSALPYYRALNLQGSRPQRSETKPPLRLDVPTTRYSESDLLPIRSTRLTPGKVSRREIRIPGFTPLFIIGDDARSRDWLRKRGDSLRTLHAIGFVVQVDSREALASLRRLAPGLTLTPVSGDDLAQRLKLTHYPVLITSTYIEQ